MGAKLVDFDSFKVKSRDVQIQSLQDEFDRILGCIIGYQLGEIRTTPENLLELIKNDIIAFQRN